MKLATLAPLFASLVWAGLCQADPPTAPTATGNPALEALGLATKSPAKSDQELLQTAAEFNHAEIALGALGKDSKDGNVRALAERLTSNHEEMQRQLEKLAAAKGVILPRSPSAVQSKRLAELKTKTDREFNEQFLKTQLLFHQGAAAIFRKNANLIDDPAVRTFASQLMKGAQVNLGKIQATTLEPVAESPKRRTKIPRSKHRGPGPD